MSAHDAEAAARAELRERQGSGARYDAPEAPAERLTLARRGTAYFARKLNELGDAALDEDSLLPGWSRRHVIAHVGYNARALTRLVDWARTGVENPMYASAEQRAAEIELGATTPARALRNLFAHTEVALNVAWRDLPGECWDAEVRTAQGRLVPVRETAWMRTREVWLHAVDLGNGGDTRDFPSELLTALCADVVGSWERRGEKVDLVLAPEGGEPTVLGAGGPAVRGPLPDLVRWLTGRGASGVTSDTGELPVPPRWL
ncbi:maleylpyruvate isomerase family mycothiol-dependent enzyme [Saccharomonospora sp. NPDC006951]